MDAADFLKHTLDPGRLAVLGLIAARPSDADELATASAQPLRTVLAAVAPLVQAGIVRRDGDGSYHLVPEALRELAASLPQPAPPHPRIMFGMTDAESTVLSRYFTGTRLKELPASHMNRRVVLERLALEFEPGRRYPEREVNDLLTAFHDDYALLRRALVDEGFLDRSRGVYWRAGGRVSPED